MSAVVGTAIRELPGFQAGREAERDDAVAWIRARALSVDSFVKRDRLTAKEGSDLQSWLRALGDDIRAGLHEAD